MRVTRIWDQSGEARRKRHWALRRKRGTTLTEMVLYLGIAAAVMTFASVMTFSFGLLREEQVRSERTALAAELAQITTAAQTCVAANYGNIRDQLVNDPSGRRTDQGL
jgi:Tfp pilus assembly protein FimT